MIIIFQSLLVFLFASYCESATTIFPNTNYNEYFTASKQRYEDSNYCQNLRYTSYSKSIKTDNCVILFENYDCWGELYVAQAGDTPNFWGFNDKAGSFRNCVKRNSWIRFYRDLGLNYILAGYSEESLIPTLRCTNIITGLRSIKSLKADRCVVLFTQENCEGSAKIIESSQNGVDLDEFKDLTVSFRVCKENETMSSTYDVIFYAGTFFQGGSVPYERASTTCQNLNLAFRKMPQSLKTVKCIELFEHEECKGTPYQVNAGNISDLQYFKRKLVSFRTCEKSDDREFHVKMYRKEDFTDVLLDVDLGGKLACRSKHFGGNVLSIITPVCLDLFSSYDCNGGFSLRLDAGNHSSIPGYISDKIGSFIACNASEIERQPNPFNLRLISLSASAEEPEVINGREFPDQLESLIAVNSSSTFETQLQSSPTIQHVLKDNIWMKALFERICSYNTSFYAICYDNKTETTTMASVSELPESREETTENEFSFEPSSSLLKQDILDEYVGSPELGQFLLVEPTEKEPDQCLSMLEEICSATSHPLCNNMDFNGLN